MDLHQFLLLLFAVPFLLVRVAYHPRARQGVQKFESRLQQSFMLGNSVLFHGALGVWLLRPHWLEATALPMPTAARIVGSLFGLLAVAFLWWVHRTLGKNYHHMLHRQADQQLITEGPYRRVRHPMYTALIGLGLALLLVTGDWLIGGLYLSGICSVAAWRMGPEEALMVEAFGDAYRAYMARTGRLLPRFA